MATKTSLFILSILLITTYCEEVSEEIKILDESDENIEYTTIHSEEEEYRTTTHIPLADEVRNRRNERPDEDIKNHIDKLIQKELEARITKNNEEELVLEKEINHKIDREDNLDNITDGVEATPASLNNDEQLNLTNNIDVMAKTETIPMQSTTKAFDDEEPLPKMQNPKEIETQAPRIAKSENDPDRSFTQQAISPPQSTRSIVRGWLDDSWIRSPVGILVPLRASALSRALAVWNDLNTSSLNLSRICFMAYDENGISWRSKHSLHPTAYRNHEKTVGEALSKLLLKYKGVSSSDSRNDGTMRALMGAAKLVPYDSALFIITDGGAGDHSRLALALRAVVEKRLKVYTLWTNPSYPDAESEAGLQALKNISKHTEGDVIPYPLQVIDLDGSSNLAELEQWSYLTKQGRRPKLIHNTRSDKFDILVVRRGAGQVISLGVPVENGVTALRIFIEGAVEHAVLYPPNDAVQIDLYNVTSVSSFSPSSRTEGLSPRDVHLVFPGNSFDIDSLSVLPASETAYVGMWHLSVRCDNCDYRLCVSAKTLIHLDAVVETSSTLKFRVTGPVASVRESQLVDEYGNELAKLTFNYQPMAGENHYLDKDPNVELVAEVALPPIKSSKIYSKIVGRDVAGQPFVRLAGPLVQSEVRLGRSAALVFPDSLNDLERVEELNSKEYNQRRYNYSVEPFSRISQVMNQQGALLTTVQIGLASRLYGNPGDRLQLHFEVTNYRDQSVRFDFGASMELRFLTGISPSSQTIPSGQTVNVIVSLQIPSNAQPGTRDTVTFTAYGNEQLSMAAYVYVANTAATIDTWAPEVRHSFQGTCLGRTGDDCALYTWAVTVVAKDGGAGLLRLSSSPIGLLYNGEFTSGTREEVVATYRATCCAPRLLVSAVDAYGNANSYSIDISWYLTETAIAAIALGVFLAIALIVLLILLIYWCVKKRRESRELPNYNTRS